MIFFDPAQVFQKHCLRKISKLEAVIVMRLRTKVLIWTACVIAFALLVVAGIFIFRNFHLQYKLSQGITVTDFTQEEYDFMKEEIGKDLDFVFPDYLQLRQGYTANTFHECPFSLLFSFPEDKRELFRAHIDGEQFEPLSHLPALEVITIDGKEYPVQKAYDYTGGLF